MLEIDGRIGEGGGQVLRSALTLSILTNQPFTINYIRQNRSNPGLQAQHLKAIDAAAAVSKAVVSGAQLHAREITFVPGELRTGRYKFEIGTAGSTSLVLQTILLPLAKGGSASSVLIGGGTHVPWSPSFHYLSSHWMYYLTRLGFNADLVLDKAGFYPQGGGRISAVIRPCGELNSLTASKRNPLSRITGYSGVANLSPDIAERQKRRALQHLQKITNQIHIKTVRLQSHFKGTFIILIAEFGDRDDDTFTQAAFCALGALHKPAEKVTEEVITDLTEFLTTDAAIDPFLADQLQLPLSFGSGESIYTTSRVTKHLLTNTAIIELFGAAGVSITGELGTPGTVRILPRS